MFDHVEFPVGAIGASRRFFASVLSELGVEEFFFDRKAGSAGFGTGDVTGLLVFEGDFGPRRLHVCFTASSAERVAAAYNAGLNAGGRVMGGLVTGRIMRRATMRRICLIRTATTSSFSTATPMQVKCERPGGCILFAVRNNPI